MFSIAPVYCHLLAACRIGNGSVDVFDGDIICSLEDSKLKAAIISNDIMFNAMGIKPCVTGVLFWG